MTASRQNAVAWRLLPWIALAVALGACGKAKSERRDGARGGTTSTGGMPSGGSGGNAGTPATGGSSAGSSGVGGTSGNGSGGDAGEPQGGSAGDAGAPTGGTSTGGTSSGGEGGEGGGTECVDVCALHGASCCIPNVECVSADSNCVFDVLAEHFNSAYNYAELEQRISEIPQDLLLSFTLDDVEWAAADPAPAARIELHMSMALSQRHGTTLTSTYNNPFRVSCDGQELFVGLFYQLEGAAAFDSPVIHADRDEQGQVIIRLGARMGAWLFRDAPEESRLRVDRPELRGALCLQGPLGEVTDP
jgi:hypothetical protein